MTAHAKSVAESALALSADDRAELAERLFESLDEDYQSDLTAAWNAEIEARLADIEQGRVTLIPGDEALRMIRERTKP